MSYGRGRDSKREFARESSQSTKDFLSDSSSSTTTTPTTIKQKQQKQKEAMQKLAKNFKKKSSEKKQADGWSSLISNLITTQRGKLPLLLAVEAGNQSMVRELLSAQTAEQLKVSECSISMCKHFADWSRITCCAKLNSNFLANSDKFFCSRVGKVFSRKHFASRPVAIEIFSRFEGEKYVSLRDEDSNARPPILANSLKNDSNVKSCEGGKGT
jgi:hypothetical protein